ncbi:MAG: S8 family serine peptidase [Candidatus Paceibacterota bacterium]|jgi:hypothetical protein
MKENYGERGNISIEKFKDIRGSDLSKEDLSNISVDILITTNFDTETKWPNKEKLPVNFNPEVILENGKNPGLGIKELHKQGITGEGINVAIIDQKLDLSHQEYFHNVVSYEEIGKSVKEEISMHGPAVASIFIGKNCGIAPEAKLHYEANPSAGNSNWDCSSESLNKIIDFNNTVEEKDKIKVVSFSNGYPNPAFKGNLKNLEKTIKKAKNSGIIFIDANTFFESNFIAGGSSSDKEDIDKYKIWLAIDNKIPMFDKINSSWNKKDRIVVPADYRTVASSINKSGEYCFYGRGGISWSIPYLAGLCSLMLQVNKNLKMEEIIKIIQNTALTNKDGLKIVNPKGAIELVKLIVKKI